MTKGLGLFLVFYILVGQPALLGWILDNGSLYQLAGLNAGVFFISWIISLLCNPGTSNVGSGLSGVIEKSEDKNYKTENEGKLSMISGENESESEYIVADKRQDVEPLVEGKDNDEKSEEKNGEKPLKENVSIPKIVQPLSGHKAPKKKGKDLMWGQRLVMLLTLGVAAVIAWTLKEFLGARGITIALLLGWILYLIIGKLFDVDGFYNAKKLFTNWLYIILIIAGIGFGIYSLGNNNSIDLLKDKFVSYVKDSFKSEKGAEDNVEVDTGDVIYVYDWTGEVISNTGDNIEFQGNIGVDENESLDDENGNGETSGQNLDNQSEVSDQSQIDIQEQNGTETDTQSEEQIQQSASEDLDRQVTWGEALKHLLQGYTLSTKTDKTFVYVAKSNELYPYFKTAQEKAMIGFDINPDKRISCETYMSLKGILEGWKVNIYDKNQTRTIYWNKAYELGKTNGCDKGAFVKVKNL